MKYRERKLNHYEKIAKQQKLASEPKPVVAPQYTGRYIYQNRSKTATLALPQLPDPNSSNRQYSGQIFLKPSEKFEGNSYYHQFLQTGELLLIDVLEEKIEPIPTPEPTVLQENTQETNMDKKLILDQPDSVTADGKVEYTIPDNLKTAAKKSNKSKTETVDHSKDTLLVEDPMAGIEILRD